MVDACAGIFLLGYGSGVDIDGLQQLASTDSETMDVAIQDMRFLWPRPWPHLFFVDATWVQAIDWLKLGRDFNIARLHLCAEVPASSMGLFIETLKLTSQEADVLLIIGIHYDLELNTLLEGCDREYSISVSIDVCIEMYAGMSV